MKIELATAVGVSATTGIAGVVALFDFEYISNIELLAYMASIMASWLMVIAGIAILVSMDWRMKLIIIPWFLSGIIFIAYTYGPYPIELAGELCQLLDSIGIMMLLFFIIWNRRCRNVGKEGRQKANSEKANPKTQKKMNTCGGGI